MVRITTSWWARAAAVGLLLAVPVVSWWLVGDLSDDVADPDHLVPPFDLSPGAEQAVGITAAAVALGCAFVVGWAWWHRRLGRRWRPTLVLLVIAGAAFGVGWRVLTAGAAGANRDAGLVLLIGLPAIVAFIGVAIVVGVARRPDRVRNGKKRRKRTHIREDSPVSSADRV